MFGATSRSPIVLRKVHGAFDACRHVLKMASGYRLYPASLLSTAFAFLALLTLPVLVLATVFALLHSAPTESARLATLHPSTFGPAVMGLVAAKELREKRANLHEQGKAILSKADAEKRELTTEEATTFDKIGDDIDKLAKDIERLDRHERTDAELRASRGTVIGRANARGDDGTDENTDDVDANAEKRKKLAKDYEAAYDAYLRYGKGELEPEQRRILRLGSSNLGTDAIVNETRGAQTVTTTGGGYLIPQGFSGMLEENLKAFGGVEAVADIFETDTGNALPWPTVDDVGNSGRLLAINTGATNTAVAYGVITLNAYKFSSDYVLVPVELMQDAAFDLNAHLAGVLATRIGRVHNTYQTTGTGSSQPQGIVVGSSSGVTAAATTSVTWEELLDLIHSVDPAYRNPQFGAGFMLNDGTLKILRKIKDGEGRPLWQPGLTAAQPDTIFGYPYTINQDMAAMTTGLKPILFGAMKKFKVRKVKGFTLLRLEERFADAHQIAYLAFTRMDSIVLDSGTNDPLRYITMA